MAERIKYSLLFLQDSLEMAWVREWFETACRLFQPTRMRGRGLTQGNYRKFNKNKFFDNLTGQVEEKKILVAISDMNFDNRIEISKNPAFENIVSMNYVISEDIHNGCVDDLIGKLMQKGGIVAYKCSLSDNIYQNADQLSDYELFEWSLEGVKTKLSEYGRTIIDTEYNPGHSHTPNGIWFGSCYRMWFGKDYYQYISKEKLQSFTNCYENRELENEVIRITLYEDVWEYAKEENREIQWDFRKSVGMDEVAHELEKNPAKKKPSDPEVEILTGTFPHGGVRLIHQYFDEADNMTRKSKAKLVRSAEYSTDGKILFQEEKKLC